MAAVDVLAPRPVAGDRDPLGIVSDAVVAAPSSLADRASAYRPAGQIARFDDFVRRDDTWLARCLSALSSTTGTAYTTSRAKRSLDLLLGIPLLLIALVPLAVLLLVNKLLSPHHPALFLQNRVGREGGMLRVPKIRSMVPGDHSPTCTPFGRVIRRYYLDELPQLLLVVTGRLSLVGVRVLPAGVYGGLQRSWSPERFADWTGLYGRTALGLTGVQQVFRRGGKEDERRYHRDRFYARHASLGFDLYLLWRTLGTTDSGPRRANSPSPRPATRRSAPVLLLGLAALLVPWALHLGLSPGEAVTSAYTNLFWAGYDGALILAMSVTAALAVFRRREAAIVAALTAILLVADAWLDISSARPGWPLVMALSRAILLELPIAVFTLRIACLVTRGASRRASEDARDDAPGEPRRSARPGGDVAQFGLDTSRGQ